MQSVLKFVIIAAVASFALSNPLNPSMLNPTKLLDPAMLNPATWTNPEMYQQQLMMLFAGSDWQQKAQDVAMKLVEQASTMASLVEEMESKKNEIEKLISSGGGQDQVKAIIEQMHSTLQDVKVALELCPSLESAGES